MNRMRSPTAVATSKESTRPSCTRCNGYLVHELWVHRCIQCGDVTDEVILRNRLSNAETVCAAGA